MTTRAGNAYHGRRTDIERDNMIDELHEQVIKLTRDLRVAHNRIERLEAQLVQDLPPENLGQPQDQRNEVGSTHSRENLDTREGRDDTHEVQMPRERPFVPSFGQPNHQAHFARDPQRQEPYTQH